MSTAPTALTAAPVPQAEQQQPAAAEPTAWQHMTDWFTMPGEQYNKKYPDKPSHIINALESFIPGLREAGQLGKKLEGTQLDTFVKDQLAHPENFAQPGEFGAGAMVGLAEGGAKSIIEKLGLKYKGELTSGSGVHMFEHPDHPGQTAALHESKISSESVQAKMDSKLNEFRNAKPIDFSSLPGHISHGKIPDVKTAEIKPRTKDGFYSHLEHVIENKVPNQVSRDQLLNTLKSQGVSKREMEWAGFDEYSLKPSLSKDKILAQVQERSPHVETVEKGAKTGDPYNEELKSRHATARESLKEGLRNELGLSDERANRILELGHNDDPQILIEKLTEEMSRRELSGLPSKHLPKVIEWVEKNGDRLQEFNDLNEEMEAQGEGFSLGNSSKYESYTLPGGTNYREVLLQLPYDKSAERMSNTGIGPKVTYDGPHFDEPNVVAHLRLKDRTDVNGKKTLFIEELQSDWARELREAKSGSLNYDPEVGSQHKAPDMPFDKSWHELALKKALEIASRENYDQVAWTTGEQQADRYNLRNYFTKVNLRETDTGLELEATPQQTLNRANGGRQFYQETTEDDLPRLVGKENAKNLLEQIEKNRAEANPDFVAKLDFDKPQAMGGEHHLALYDEMVPRYLNKYTKRWGGQVGETQIKTKVKEPNPHGAPWMEDGMVKVHALPVTPAMREGVARGQQLIGSHALDFSAIKGHVAHEPTNPQELTDIKKKTGLPLSDEAAERRIKERSQDSKPAAKPPVSQLPGPEPSKAELDAVRKETGLPLSDEAATKRVKERTDATIRTDPKAHMVVDKSGKTADKKSSIKELFDNSGEGSIYTGKKHLVDELINRGAPKAESIKIGKRTLQGAVAPEGLTLYHGTDALSARKILKEGLIPKSKDFSKLSTNLGDSETALEFIGYGNAESYEEGEPFGVLLKVNIPPGTKLYEPQIGGFKNKKTGFRKPLDHVKIFENLPAKAINVVGAWDVEGDQIGHFDSKGKFVVDIGKEEE